MWHQLEPTSAHVAYALLGTISLFFSLVSLILKEQLFVGEAIVGTLFGCIIGPYVLNWFNPSDWTDNVDELTMELSRLILIIQLFSTGAELPSKYMKNHFKSLTIVLFGAMIAGWLVLAICVYLLFRTFGLSFSDSLLVGATFVATDPVLAAAIVGKSKFAERIRVDVKNLIQAESGANDGLAFPFVTLSINLVLNRPDNAHAGTIVKDWIVLGILYQCAFGVVLGVVIGFCGRKAVLFTKKKNWIDMESFLVFYIALSFINTGLGSILGCDDLLASFSAGCAFSWDGTLETTLHHRTPKSVKLGDDLSFENGEQEEEVYEEEEEENDEEEEEEEEEEYDEEEEHVYHEVMISTVIDLLLNTAYFVYLGSIIPWSSFSQYAWRLVVLGLCFIFLARVPALLILQPIVPDLRSWKDALFVGHFGPRGVGSIFCSLLAKHLLEQSSDNLEKHQVLYDIIWTIVTFIVVVSIIVHGLSICVFTIYTTAKKIPIRKGAKKNSSDSESIELRDIARMKHKNSDSEELDPVAIAKPAPAFVPSSQNPYTEELATSRKRISKFVISSVQQQSKTSLSASQFPKYAYMYKNSIVLVDSSGDVLDEFDIKSDSGFTSSTGSNSLVAYRTDNEIYIENGDKVIVRRYKIEDII